MSSALGLLGAATAAAVEEVVPVPQGWIGTAADWSRALGIGFALIDLALLLLAVAWIRRAGVTPAVRQILVLAIVILPLAVVFFGYHYGLNASTTVSACGSCHVMTPYVGDLRNPAGDSLAAVHFKNRYIQDKQCYTCHSDYGMSGTLRAKLEGLGHVVRYASASYTLPITIARPYANVRCLHCHGASQKFLTSGAHGEDMLPALRAGETSCLDCHGPAHNVARGQAAR